jgi:addiction module HigA family antidote
MIMVLNVARPLSRRPSHPGALLGDIIADCGRTRSKVAAMIGLSEQHLLEIIEERKPVSAAIAARLGKAFGDGADVWVRQQSAHDL